MPEIQLKTGFTQSVINILSICLIATGTRYAKRGIISQYQVQELKAKNAEMELQFLKAQLNPHFLFNTLNNICAINQMNPEKGTEMIMELSDLFRYHLDYSSKKTISLAKEWDIVQSFVTLEKLRLTDKCTLTITATTNLNSLSIAPLLLLPFVENAFKHGVHPKKECFVRIALKVINNQICFEVVNSKIRANNVVSTNIGLENTRKRLQLLYANNHDLIIQEDKDSYSVTLTLTL